MNFLSYIVAFVWSYYDGLFTRGWWRYAWIEAIFLHLAAVQVGNFLAFIFDNPVLSSYGAIPIPLRCFLLVATGWHCQPDTEDLLMSGADIVLEPFQDAADRAVDLLTGGEQLERTAIPEIETEEKTA